MWAQFQLVLRSVFWITFHAPSCRPTLAELSGPMRVDWAKFGQSRPNVGQIGTCVCEQGQGNDSGNFGRQVLKRARQGHSALAQKMSIGPQSSPLDILSDIGNRNVRSNGDAEQFPAPIFDEIPALGTVPVGHVLQMSDQTPSFKLRSLAELTEPTRLKRAGYGRPRNLDTGSQPHGQRE